MYIAFKWLVALSTVLWLGLCILEIYMRKFEKTTYSTQVKLYQDTHMYKNVSNSIVIVPDHWTYAQPVAQPKYTQHNIAYLHYVMFLVGAFAVSVFNKKKAIIIYTKNKFETIPFRDVYIFIKNVFCDINFKKFANRVNVPLMKLLSELCRISRNSIPKVTIGNQQKLNETLLKRVKEIWLDRKTLGRLLIAAINENKNIRMQCRVESLAKNRLAQYVEESQKLIKENRTRYVSFQQLYLVTHRENVLLKSHIQKLTYEKDEAEKNLMGLINEVYQSKNSDLKASCTRFIVHTKDNLLNRDVNAEIKKFLRRSKKPPTSVSNEKSVSNLKFKLSQSNSLPEILADDSKLDRLLCDGPKLRGLPGEYVWTVKDKNGLIEKLYEYNFETDYDNGDTIRRIREYSVYHDKDCLLDHTNLLKSIPTCPSLSASATRIRLDINPIQNHRFLSGSKEFQIFLRNKPSLLPRAHASPLTCG